MATMAIIGAGPGLGAAAAARFGRAGLSAALISRNQDKLDELSAGLRDQGISARGYAADVADRAGLAAALNAAAGELGPITVLQYSPVPAPGFLQPVLETTPADYAAAMAFSTLGLATAVDAVLPGMTEHGRGTILLVNGASAATPNAKVAGTSVGFAAETAYATMLHTALQRRNIHVGQLIIPGAIGGGDPLYAPDALAERLWQIHTGRGAFRTTVQA